MAYTNNLLFNNVFLKNLHPTDEEMAAARYLVHGSARDWFRDADFTSPARLAETWVQPLLQQQSLDLVPAGLADENAWFIVAPWDRENPLALCYVAPAGADLDGYDSERRLPKGRHWMIRAVSAARRAGRSESPLGRVDQRRALAPARRFFAASLRSVPRDRPVSPAVRRRRPDGGLPVPSPAALRGLAGTRRGDRQEQARRFPRAIRQSNRGHRALPQEQRQRQPGHAGQRRRDHGSPLHGAGAGH